MKVGSDSAFELILKRLNRHMFFRPACKTNHEEINFKRKYVHIGEMGQATRTCFVLAQLRTQMLL